MTARGIGQNETTRGIEGEGGRRVNTKLGGEHPADLVLGPICAAQDVRPKVSGGKFTNEGAWRRAECNYKRYLRGGGEHLGTIMQERATTNTDDAYGYAENA